jgi:glyoxylase-like metal-dependent hydrolase (beta-lactamase superfamily II)
MTQPAARGLFEIGDTTITYLPDGEGRLDPAFFFPGSMPDGWATHSESLDRDGRFTVSIGSFLIRTARQNILVDLGLGQVDYTIGDVAAFRAGMLLDSLAAEGLTPADIDTVFFTHLHHDHVGWTTDIAPAPDFPDGVTVAGLTFPDAEYIAAEPEWRYWSERGTFPGPDATAVLAPLADRIRLVAGDAEIAPGVRVLATPGHTPGHSSLVVTAPTTDRRAIVLGDVMHCQAQVVRSEWTCFADVDPDQAIRTRELLLKELEDEQTVLAAGHFTGSVFGRVLPPTLRRAWSSRI